MEYGGMNIERVYVEEAAEISEPEYQRLLGALTVPVDGHYLVQTKDGADVRQMKAGESVELDLTEPGSPYVRNGVAYRVLPDGGLKMVCDNPNSMTYEYDVATGKRCLVSQSGEYIGEWF